MRLPHVCVQKDSIHQRCREGQLLFDNLAEQAIEAADSAAQFHTDLDTLSSIVDLALATDSGPDRQEISLGELKRM